MDTHLPSWVWSTLARFGHIEPEILGGPGVSSAFLVHKNTPEILVTWATYALERMVARWQHQHTSTAASGNWPLNFLASQNVMSNSLIYKMK